MDIAYASVSGDVMASEVTHAFGKMGTKLVMQIGTCGGLAKNLLPGDLICVNSAYCGEGAVRHLRLAGTHAGKHKSRLSTKAGRIEADKREN